MKKIVIIMMLLALAACKQQEEIIETTKDEWGVTTGPSNTSEKDDTGVVLEDLSATLTQEQSENANEKTFIYQVINHTNENMEIPFSLGGGFDYIVRSINGTQITKQVNNGDIISNQVIAAGEAIYTKIILNGLEKGMYELEVWLNSELENSYNQVIEFEVE